MQRLAAFMRSPHLQDIADVGMALALAAFVLGSAALHRSGLDFTGVVLALGQTLPLAVRRRSPNLVLATTGFSIAFYSGLGYPELGGNVGVLVAFYTVAANRPRRYAAFAALLCGFGVFLTLLNYAASSPEAMQQLLAVYLEYVVAWLVGDYVRVRRLYIRELEERAARLDLERDDEARQAVARERTRIARELHDVVAHHVSVMVVQASGARRVVDTNPGAARAALGAVEDAGRTALSEMRRMLEVLRAEEPGRAPQPSLAEIDRLVGEVRSAGLPVDLAIAGEVRQVPAGIDLAAYRIVQEALTNSMKHAGSHASAVIRICYEPACLDIEVTDDGRGAAASLRPGRDGGQGLIGMRERASLYGGWVEAAPLISGGFRVHARLPLPPLPAAARTMALAEVRAAAARHHERTEVAISPGSRAPAETAPARVASLPGSLAGSVAYAPAAPGGESRPLPPPSGPAATPPSGPAATPSSGTSSSGTPSLATPSPGDPPAAGAAPGSVSAGGPVFSPWPEEARP